MSFLVVVTELPRGIHNVLGVARSGVKQELASFFRDGAADNFRIFLDDTCMRPENWKTHWDKPPHGEHEYEFDWWPTKYGAQGFIPHMVHHSPFLTTDWRRANASIAVLYVYHMKGAMAAQQAQCLERLRKCSPAFRHDNGNRHFFIFPNDRGPCCVDGRYKDVEFLQHRIIGNGERGTPWIHFPHLGAAPKLPCHDDSKDISIAPPIMHSPAVPNSVPFPPRTNRSKFGNPDNSAFAFKTIIKSQLLDLKPDF